MCGSSVYRRVLREAFTQTSGRVGEALFLSSTTHESLLSLHETVLGGHTEPDRTPELSIIYIW